MTSWFRKVHWAVGDSMIACQSMEAPADRLRTTNAAEVTCQCCLPYAMGRFEIGEFATSTLRKAAKRERMRSRPAEVVS